MPHRDHDQEYHYYAATRRLPDISIHHAIPRLQSAVAADASHWSATAAGSTPRGSLADESQLTDL